MTTPGSFYVAAVTILFFFWVYGIVAFVRDLRSTYIPALRKYRAGRREQADQEQNREQRERQLY